MTIRRKVIRFRPCSRALAAVDPARRPALAGLDVAPVALPILGRTDAVDRGRPDRLRGRSGFNDHGRCAALLDRLDRGAEQPAIGADRLVRASEMLVAAVGDL